MGCVYREWAPTHTVVLLGTSAREWKLIWERGKPWTVYLETEGSA